MANTEESEVYIIDEASNVTVDGFLEEMIPNPHIKKRTVLQSRTPLPSGFRVHGSQPSF
jgi:hypothetical protein